MNLKKMRPGNLRAFNLILERLQAGEPTTSIVKPTRYGKRDLIITSCWQAVRADVVSGGIVFSPAAQATRQFSKESKLLETITRYEMPPQDVLNGVRQLKTFSEYQPFSNGEFLLAANIQLCLRTNIDDCIELIEAERRRTGKPPVMFIDECQFLADKKRWGDFFRRLQNAGVLLVFLTATPYREDADAIPGFRYTQIDVDDERRYFVSDAGDGIHNRIDVWDGVRSLTKLEADNTTTFREAWAEIPPVLCKLDRQVVSIDIDGKPLKDLKAADTRKQLGKVVRDERFLDPAVRLVLNNLQLMQTIDPNCKAMVVTGSDQENDRRDNAHAKTIEKLALHLSPMIMGRSAKVRIVTLKTKDTEDESLAKAMEAFLDSDEDVVVVKQAGTVGLDDWRLKVLGDFSPNRSVANMIQRWMRPATPHGGLTIAHLVMPDDCFSTAVWEKLIVEEGGEAKLSELSSWEGNEKVGSYLKQKEDDVPPDPPLFGPGAISGFDDSRGNIGGLEYYEIVARIFQREPRVAAIFTKAEFAGLLKESGHAPGGTPQPPTWGLDQQLEVLRDQIVEKAKEKTNRRMMRQTGGNYDQALFQTIIKEIYRSAYRSVGLPLGITLGQVTNIDTLRHLNMVINNVGDEIPT